MSKKIKIIGDDIYYDGVLVAKFVDTPRATVKGEFIDIIKRFIRNFNA